MVTDPQHVHGELQQADVPLGCEPPAPTACLGLYLATRTPPGERARAFRDRPRVLDALARGALAIDDTIRVEGRPDTVGRYLVLQCLPAAYRDPHDAPWDRLRVVQVLSRITRDLHVELAARCAMALTQLGRYVAERSGFSLAMTDFAPGFSADDLLAAAWSAIAACEDDYRQGLITDGERYNRAYETWHLTTARLRVEARRHAPNLDPLAACAASVPDSPPPEHLRVMGGPIQRRSSGLYERPVLGALGGGLDVHEYFMCCQVAGEARSEVARRTRVAARLGEALHAALGGVAIVARDCDTATGVAIRALLDEATVVASVGQRAEGHVVVEAVTAPSYAPERSSSMASAATMRCCTRGAKLASRLTWSTSWSSRPHGVGSRCPGATGRSRCERCWAGDGSSTLAIPRYAPASWSRATRSTRRNAGRAPRVVASRPR